MNLMKKLILLGGSSAPAVPNYAPPVTANLTLDFDSRIGLFTTSLGTTPVSADGDPVGLWNDQSGAGRNISQATAGRRATYKLNQVNSLPAVLFDGTDDRLVSVALLSTIITNTAYSLYVVFNANAINTNAANTYDNDAVIADQAGGFWGLHLKSAPTAHAYNYDGTDDNAAKAIATGTWLQTHQRHDAGNMVISRDGGSETSTASGNTQTISNVFGVGRNSNTAFFDGMVARILCYNVAHNATDKNAIIAYLKSTYGLP